MSNNTLSLLLSIVKQFEQDALQLWMFGGWAEELWQMVPPRAHHDMDFLYPARTFEHFDRVTAQTDQLQEVKAKHFSHKRAFLHRDVLIEFFLVQQDDRIYFTNFLC